ncbi:hypothetical protein SBOR_8422 [Sclerotinia borealis F-4128]|uniref:Uncharacterized protein n=1 Tax=Sclerotinia borealis (strain F-4128) TaxID=1432307 RepID=W9C8K7_SCLBF|nr:hypothetical protein SBOR_8422 [Sclerotinia borealis F-4128]
MQQNPDTPSTPHPLHKQQRTSSFHSIFPLSSLNPLRTLLSRAPSPDPSNSTTSAPTTTPRIPQIHPHEYPTYQSSTQLLKTFTSCSIARSRCLAARIPLESNSSSNNNTDTYRSIHCGDQTCCFASPYSFYRSRSASSRSKHRAQTRSRSISNPNLRLAPSPPSSPLHPFRRSLTITGSSKRATSLFEGSPPPAAEKSLSGGAPLYEYPEPIGARSSSWLGINIDKERMMGMELERSKSVSWAPETGGLGTRNRMARQFYRPSGLSMFSWTAEDAKGSELVIGRNGGKGAGDEGEREIAYEWDGAFGWMQACRECGRERCVECSGVVFEQIVGEGETVTGVEAMYSICTPCVHGFCPGTKMWLRVRCQKCGEVGCEGCEDMNAKKG